MSEQVFGAKRCRDARKPELKSCPKVLFYRCKTCGAVYTQVGMDIERKELSCCGGAAEALTPQSIDKAQEKFPDFSIDYKITGGYNDNAVLVYWNRTDVSYFPEWIYLKTFTGGYMKISAQKKRPPMVFALADTDAFAYCDEDPCLECTFRCKRGFVIYVYTKKTGLIEIPLDKMSPYWQS